jgi:lysophospholipase L1-like esterase
MVCMRLPCFALILAVLFSCGKKNGVVPAIEIAANSPATPPAIHTNDSVSYLALGDSYTFGAGVSQSESYPYQLAGQLNGQHYFINDPRVVAFQGWTAADLLAGIESAKVTRKFDFVTLLIGVNDENRNTDRATYTTQVDQLITQATEYARGYSGRVFVLSIPDWSVTPFAAGMDKAKIKADVAMFNSINEAECKKLGASYLDISTISELAANDATLTASDGLHPSAKMYALWINYIYGNITATF